MTMKVTFELSNKDIVHFRTLMRQIRDKGHSEEQILAAAAQVFEEVQRVRVPTFVTERMARLRQMIDMVQDEEWRLPATERGRVLNALAYFTEPEDLIPDHIPGLGFLDDAIMVELVVRALKHEIEAYEDFCRFRDDEDRRAEIREQTLVERKRRVDARRHQLLERMRRRGRRERRTRRTRSGPRLTLF